MTTTNWARWKQHFLANEARPPVEVERDGCITQPLLRTLAILQRAETGEGRVAKAIDGARFHNIDDDYRASLKLFVREEARHAGLLAALLEEHGERPLTHTWRDGAFSRVRRLAGVRFKLFVFLVAELCAVLVFGLLFDKLPDGAVRRSLERMLGDEEKHLEFHAEFFRTAIENRPARVIFRLAFTALAIPAAIVMVFDHRETFAELGSTRLEAVARFARLLKETLDLAAPLDPARVIISAS
jgi:demethoxyubiquinone hydroxylase (CLK1/Coq7/Cat5 family)